MPSPWISAAAAASPRPWIGPPVGAAGPQPLRERIGAVMRRIGDDLEAGPVDLGQQRVEKVAHRMLAQIAETSPTRNRCGDAGTDQLAYRPRAAAPRLPTVLPRLLQTRRRR